MDGYWRDAKIVNDHVYIGSEAEGHGVQIFDLKRLDHLEIPEKGLERGDVPRLELDGYVDTVGSSHNIVAFPEKQQILVVGYGFPLITPLVMQKRENLLLYWMCPLIHPTPPSLVWILGRKSI